ncbi:NAD(P)-binding protein [Aspergillus heterothallicus]
MSRLIVIVGVTGIQGSSLADTFLQLPGWNTLIGKGVEVVEGDLDDRASLASAFRGATVIFSNTDWVTHVSLGLSTPEILNGRSATQYGYDREIQQGLNIAEAAATPDVVETLERFIYSSLSDARRGSGGKYPHIWHNQSKIETIRRIHEQFPALAERLSTIQLAHYVTNWKNSPALRPHKEANGTYVIKHTFPADFPMLFLVAHKDTGAFVSALVAMPANKHLIGVSEILSWSQWVQLWGKVHGVAATYRQVPEEEYFNGFPYPLMVELRDTFRYVQEFGYTGGDPEVMTAEQHGVEIPVTSVAEYISSEDWSEVLRD